MANNLHTMTQYILAFDQGTTSSRAILFDHQGTIVNIAQQEFKQYYPKPGWVEHDAEEIWASQLQVAQEVLKKANVSATDIAAIGITNQRETTVVWDRSTGKPIHNAIVWQDRRTSHICDRLKADGNTQRFQQKTGLVIDAYFSGTKIAWLLDHVNGAREKARQGKLAFGTIDSWLIWNLTGGKTHVTDVTNASRTLLYNIKELAWDEELLSTLHVPSTVLPKVASSSEVYAKTEKDLLGASIPISGIAGDQQAALFGQLCTEPGMVKNTYGTGCFVVLNTGSKPITSTNNLLSTIAWQIKGKTTYALEGSIFIAGAIVQWLRDGLKLIKSSSEIEELAKTVEDNGDVYLVPALTGLGAPHWDQYARGTLVGLTRGTEAGHIARAALESMAYQTMDVMRAMRKDSHMPFKELRVDGGASANNLMMQLQSNLLDIPVVRPKIMETTALGAAYLAGLAVGYWKDQDELADQWQIDQTFTPESSFNANVLLSRWDEAVGRSKNWVKPE
uniref:Glycerol kinase n=1 Tax=Roseihalotalea indica TaxID=2867963 RepID=A0AA49JGF4_9BACT|nr:glycerol kinase GlpK [Tunicatimonas sp. TK19036]